MATRKATAEWKGGFQDGGGTFEVESDVVSGRYSATSRFTDEGEGGATNPEELVAAAHASCFYMQFAALLELAGHKAESVQTEAEVQILKEGEGFAIKKITLRTVGRVPGVDEATFQDVGRQAKEICPISKALGAVDTIELEASLAG
jgi:osmotically inducible protein OsmC